MSTGTVSFSNAAIDENLMMPTGESDAWTMITPFAPERMAASIGSPLVGPAISTMLPSGCVPW